METGEEATTASGAAARRSATDALLAEATALARALRLLMLEPPRGSPLAPLHRLQRVARQGELCALLGHAIAWLLTRKAVEAGELSVAEACLPGRRLGTVPEVAVDPAALGQGLADLDARVRALHARLARLDRLLDRAE
jgi:regulator of CtrA degradation